MNVLSVCLLMLLGSGGCSCPIMVRARRSMVLYPVHFLAGYYKKVTKLG